MGGVIFMSLPSDVRRGIGARAIYLTGPAFPHLLLSNISSTNRHTPTKVQPDS